MATSAHWPSSPQKPLNELSVARGQDKIHHRPKEAGSEAAPAPGPAPPRPGRGKA